MSRTESRALRVDDWTTVLPGLARSGHTLNPLTRGFAIEVTHVRRDHNGDYDVEGVLLTARGAWRSGVPTRSVVLPPGSYTTPIRVGDTVRYPQTGETPVVTAIHVRPEGGALADLLFGSGATTSGTPLTSLFPRTSFGPASVASLGTTACGQERHRRGDVRSSVVWTPASLC